MCHTPSSNHDADSCPFGHIDGICAGDVIFGKITPTEVQAEIIKDIEVRAAGVYDRMVHRKTDGSDPLVQEPKSKP